MEKKEEKCQKAGKGGQLNRLAEGKLMTSGETITELVGKYKEEV